MAQVHRARLVPELGGREVAVKVQRPSIEQKLLGDVANIKVGGWVGGSVRRFLISVALSCLIDSMELNRKLIKIRMHVNQCE